MVNFRNSCVHGMEWVGSVTLSSPTGRSLHTSYIRYNPEAMLSSFIFALWAWLLGIAAADCGNDPCDTVIPSYAQAQNGVCVFSPTGSNLFAIEFIVWYAPCLHLDDGAAYCQKLFQPLRSGG